MKTNSDRADLLAHGVRRGGYGHNMQFADAIKLIERALVAAERRGARRGKVVVIRSNSNP